MNTAPTPAIEPTSKRYPDWKLFLGLSRTPHGVLDMATPAMAALLWLGRFPPVGTIILGIITAFAGYTAVYALNDVVDYKIDKKRLSLSETHEPLFDMDGLFVRHPLAQGLISLKAAVLWTLFWACVALVGAWMLNPLCAVIFIISAAFEAIYCKLLRITHLKIIPSAVVKAGGGLAGVYAVDPNPSPAFVVLLFIWLAAWEIGGQNIANDIVDMEDDAKVQARTTLTVKGMRESVFIMIVAVSMAVIAGVFAYRLSAGTLGALYPIGAALLGWFLLLQPARAVYNNPGPETAARLFNWAGFMPPAFLVLITLAILVKT